MFFNKNKKLEVQVETFIKYRPGTVSLNTEDQVTLKDFANSTHKNDVSEITEDDMKVYEVTLWQHYTMYGVYSRMKLIRCFLRYFNLRYNPQRLGRPVEVNKINQVKKLVDDGRTFREVSELTGMNLSLVHRRYKYKTLENDSVKPRKNT
jgi:hypothetical protein